MPSPTEPPEGAQEPRTKACRLCQEVKPLTAFYRKPSARDGLDSRCRECCAAYMRGYWLRNPKKRKEQDQRYREQNRERLNKKSRDAYWKDPEKSRAQKLREYYKRKQKRDG
ncbi:hypothetical protein ACIGXM_14185 [Kitasatospora sp. NPDC052896]|uniref:hypothetical protein n=1 Tax=Kitasatospora sp. NPDC052896 TaxID=3364061 RepID=UPI0037C6419A